MVYRPALQYLSHVFHDVFAFPPQVLLVASSQNGALLLVPSALAKPEVGIGYLRLFVRVSFDDTIDRDL